MKIGDKVRFLSEVGGGRISGFQNKNIVLVEDADGFEIPTPISDIVVIPDDEMLESKIKNIEKANHEKDANEFKSIKARLTDNSDLDNESQEMEDSCDFVSPTKVSYPTNEREGGDELLLFLAFLPKSFNNLSNTDFSTYLVNDSNYHAYYAYAVKDGDLWMCKTTGHIDPNTKLLLEDFFYSDLNDLEDISIQIFAYKPDKRFELQPTIDTKIHLDGTKFYKRNSFVENDFFDSPAILFSLPGKDKVLPGLSGKKHKTFIKLQSSHTEEIETKPSSTSNKIIKTADKRQIRTHSTKQLLKNDKIVVDLHANELLETTTGMSAHDILEYQLQVFRNILEQYKNKNGQKIVFIHGKGEGVLRHALIHELNYKYKKYQYQDASFREYGYGATQVTITT